MKNYNQGTKILFPDKILFSRISLIFAHISTQQIFKTMKLKGWTAVFSRVAKRSIKIGLYLSGIGSFPLFLGNCNPEITNKYQLNPSTNDWTRQPIELNVNLKDVYFDANQNGWAVGAYETVFILVGGQTWSLAPITQDNQSVFRSVFIINSSKGWIAGDQYGSPVKGQIQYSGIGGSYPIQQKVVSAPLNCVYFTDVNTGWVAGDAGLVYHTTDGGDNWSQDDMGTTDSIYGLYFVDKTKGWAVTENGGLFHTYDGTSWKQEESGVTSDLNSIQFTDSLHGWICGDRNTILVGTANPGGGLQWVKDSVATEVPSMKWKDIFFINPSTGWVIGQFQHIYKTEDGGTTWNQETVDEAGELNAIFMVSATKGWVVGDEGTMLTYTPK